MCVVARLRPDPGAVGITAIDKRAVDGSVKIGPYGLYADVQASRKHHGGLDKAVYVYSDEDAAFWSAELGRDLHPGWFGENLRVSGIDPNQARVGDHWRIGDGPDAVELAVTMPRTPCATFARWVGGPHARGWVKRFAEEGRLGAYFRVVKRGTVTAGDPIQVTPLATGSPTMLEVFRS